MKLLNPENGKCIKGLLPLHNTVCYILLQTCTYYFLSRTMFNFTNYVAGYIAYRVFNRESFGMKKKKSMIFMKNSKNLTNVFE